MFENAIVLTGGIATGKSTVANLFMDNGYGIIDADKIAHKLLDKNRHKIASLFGNQYVSCNKVLRKDLGQLIFNNKEEKLKLENFMHPLIKDEIYNESEQFKKRNERYLIDIPLFFENNHYDIEKIIVVYTPKEIQLQRLMKRDNSSKEDSLLKINSQMDIEDKKELATYVINNSGTIKELLEEFLIVKKELDK